MRKLLMIFALMIGLMSCGSGENSANVKSPEKGQSGGNILPRQTTLCNLYGY